MALRTCPHCKKSISSKSKTCPYCSKPLQPMIQKPKPSPNRAKFLVNVGHVWVGIAFLVGLVTYIAGYSNNYAFGSFWWIGLVVIAICLIFTGVFYTRANNLIPNSIPVIQIGVAVGSIIVIFFVFTIIATRRPASSSLPASRSEPSTSRSSVTTSPTATPDPYTPRAGAYYSAAKQFVQRQLTHPSTAKFHLSSTEKFDRGNHEYKVTGLVDAQNSFGVKLTYRYEVVMTYLGNEQWDLISVDLYEE